MATVTKEQLENFKKSGTKPNWKKFAKEEAKAQQKDLKSKGLWESRMSKSSKVKKK